MSTIIRPERWQQGTSGRQPKVLLMQLTQRTSGKGNAYLTGWLGKAKLVGFKGEPDEHGHERWDVYAAEPDQARRPQGQDGGSVRPPARAHVRQPRPEAPGGDEPFPDETIPF